MWSGVKVGNQALGIPGQSEEEGQYRRNLKTDGAQGVAGVLGTGSKKKRL